MLESSLARSFCSPPAASSLAAQRPARCRGLGPSGAELRRRRRLRLRRHPRALRVRRELDDVSLDRAADGLPHHRGPPRLHAVLRRAVARRTPVARRPRFAGHEQQLAAPYYGLGNATAYDVGARDRAARATSTATAGSRPRLARPATLARAIHRCAILIGAGVVERQDQSHALRQRHDAHSAAT